MATVPAKLWFTCVSQIIADYCHQFRSCKALILQFSFQATNQKYVLFSDIMFEQC